MKPYQRARLRLEESGRDMRLSLRAVVPFSVRRRLLNLFRDKSKAELPADRLPFPPARRYDVICLPIIAWDYLFQRPQQLLTQFAKAGHRGFYIHTTFHQSGPHSFARRLADGIYGVRLPGPAPIDFLYQGEMDTQTVETCLAALDHLRCTANIGRAVCLVQLPFWTPLALAAREQWGWKLVYDCMDEHSAFADSSINLGLEEELIAKADLVNATSQALFGKAQPRARRVLSLPNAVDFDHFSPRPVARPLAQLPRPVIGYYGAVSEWFDLEMVREAAQARPTWQFIIVGDSFGVDLKRLKSSNVHLFGRKPYSDLPAYLHEFDVACIPFRSTPLTRATNPVKFFEYLSAGKPVVASGLPDLEPYRQYFYPVDTRSNFVPQIEAALSEDSEEKAQARIDLAKQNTWRARYDALSAAIGEL